MPHHDPPRLFLIDGYALIYRAFFALITRPLRTTKGENTSAAWGVINFLLRLREKYQPDYLAWVHDAGDSFRTQLYAEYKSTREKLDDELQAEFDRSVVRIEQLLEAFHVEVVSLPGYEADDVIGTLAEQGAAAGLQVVIVSGDKDFYQLIGPRVALLNPGRGGPGGVDETWVDQSNAADRLGVPPGQVVDYLALVGDSSDNVPGVKGIGSKGAVELLTQFGSLESMLARTAEVKGKRAREALEQYQAEARLSRQLVTIRRDVPVTLDLGPLTEMGPDRAVLLKLCAELEFYTLVRRLEGATPSASAAPKTAPATPVEEDPVVGVETGAGPAAPAPAGAAPEITTHLVDDPAEIPALVTKLRAAPLVALAVGTSPVEPHNADLIGLAFAVSPAEAWYLPFAHRPPLGELAAPEPVRNLPALTSASLAPLAELLRDPAVPKAGHDLKYAWQVLRRAGVEVAGVSYDSMLASFVLDPGRRSHALDTLSLEHLGRSLRLYTDIAGRGRNEVPFDEVPLPSAAEFGAATTTTVLALEQFFAPSLSGMGLEQLLRKIELPLVRVLVDMEWTGIAIDPALFTRMSGELTRDLTELEARIASISGSQLNLNSPKQLATLLFDKLQLPVLKKTKTGPSTDADVLEQLAAMGHEVPTLILDYRELQKLKSTYVEVLPLRVNRATGRIHTSFNQTGAATGRLSSSEPNLQNIPVRTPRGEEIRKGFVPGSGQRFVVADYSQIELRLMAHLSEDPAFIAAFRSGGDIHRQTASIIFSVPPGQVTADMRARAKTINFGTIYGQGPFALSRQLNITQDEAKAFITQYFERFAGVRAYLDLQVKLARSQGYVETLFGRRRYIPEIKDKNFNLRAFAERTAANTPLQGSAADLIKLAMIRIHSALAEEKLRGRLLLQVHDELVLEAPVEEVDATAALVRRHMEGAAELKVPLVVDVGIGDNWLDAKH
ncbi:MAG TPA: DNA polymerase I [Gemmatimonadales bacterium]|nr:DNA polymerase I [Gemmatimonadales bacterium]